MSSTFNFELKDYFEFEGKHFQTRNEMCKEFNCSNSKCPANDGYCNLRCSLSNFHSLCTSSCSTFIMPSIVNKLKWVE